MPSWLGDPGREAWKEIVPPLIKAKIVTAIDREGLALLSEVHGRWRGACDLIANEGLLHDTELGSRKAHPAVRVAGACERSLLAILMQFGMTPKSRLPDLDVDQAPFDTLGRFLSRGKPPKDHIYTKGNANE
jgi:P27 family predicted phage terminase small subunit